MTINVTMIRTALGADDRQWRAGDTYAAEDDFARALIGRGDAYAADGSPQDVAPVLDAIIADYEAGTLGTGISPIEAYEQTLRAALPRLGSQEGVSTTLRRAGALIMVGAP